MDVAKFQKSPSGHLVPITGTSQGLTWQHHAFVPRPLGQASPVLDGRSYRAVADARAAIAALDATAARLPNPRLFRLPALRLEAQSTAALEGTYEPVERVLTAGDDDRADPSMREVLNYVLVAEQAFALDVDGHRLTVSSLEDLQGQLMSGTRLEGPASGRLRDLQVVIGRRPDAPPEVPAIKAAQFVPPPPGPDLRARLDDLLSWMQAQHDGIDPVVAAAMGHYCFEALHPFHDGNGRLGRLLVVLSLTWSGVLTEPSISVSPWFEARRERYYDCLLGISMTGDWSSWVTFFAQGLQSAADQAQRQMLQLVAVRDDLRERIRQSPIRSARAFDLVDHALASLTFTVAEAAEAVGLQKTGASKLIDSLVEHRILEQVGHRSYNRRFAAPDALAVLRGV
ncbi:Fic family protein [Serinicoccus profundi]|uniref:Fic family protein n=1 Tax=Serinicoccus profundi TaxID=1078471 RepID=UPI00049655A0|nr:Fic family protein [Serinicoccus profundi]